MKNKRYLFFEFFCPIIITSMMFFISGCADDGKKGENGRDGTSYSSVTDTSVIRQGVFLDSAVQGLEYESGDQFGITDEHGTFSYEVGKKVTFRIGNIVLGTAPANPEMTPLDLVTGADTYKNTTVTNMARFLQSLDEDKNPDNGITIPKGAGNDKYIDFSLEPEDFEYEAKLLIDKIFSDQRDVVSASDAQQHFRLTLLDVPGSEIDVELRELIDGLDKNIYPGVMIAILTPSGNEWIRTSGVANIETNEKIDRYARVRVGSVTKTFTGMAVSQLVQEGKLSMDDTLEDWLPGIVPYPTPEEEASGTYTGYDSRKMTIRRLLHHTTGLYNFTSQLEMQWKLFFYTERQMTPEALVEIGANNDPLSYPENLEWHYSNTNYVLLGMIIEAVTGNTYEEEVHRRFIEPLGLRFTNVPKTGDLGFPGKYAHGYFDMDNATGNNLGVANILVDITSFEPSLTWSSGNIISTPSDLTKWIKAIAEGKLFDEFHQANLFNDMFRLSDTSSLYYGYGITKDTSANLLGHRGQIPGYDTAMFYNLDIKTSVVAIITRMIPGSYGDAQKLVLNYAMDILLGTYSGTQAGQSHEP
ncbi:serine hydrolase domain-containing protein [Desulfobacterales bacterium HSG16]|nr:serine hydrolase domain-containing protein [Desulfobacterales bacterium HSG16]